MELQYLQLQTTPAKVREIDTLGIYRLRNNKGDIPVHTWMFEYTTPNYLNQPRPKFTVQDINQAATLLRDQIFSTVMTKNYDLEFHIGNYANGNATATKKFDVHSDTVIDFSSQTIYEYGLEIIEQNPVENMLSSQFYISVYFTYKGDKDPNFLPIGYADNDGLCFWHCLEKLYPLPILKLKFKELKPVSIKDIPAIEFELKTKINVISKVKNIESYKSKHKYWKEINLEFIETDKGYHYELIENSKKGEGNSVRRFEKECPIIVYDKTKYFDGTETIKYKEFPKKCHIIDFADVKKLYENKKKGIKVNTIKEAYELYNKSVKSIKEWSKGKFNLFRYRTINDFIRDTFYHSIKELGFQTKMKKIEKYELEPLEKTSKGAFMIIKSKKDIYENGYQYDMKSSYPYSLIHKLFRFPFVCAKQKTMDPKYFETNIKNKDLRYGFYHCKPIFPKHKTYFTKGKSDWFTHWDLMSGYEQGIKFELINEPNNCLYWLKDDLIDGYSVFRNYIMYFYKLKNDTKDSLVKRLLSGFWGALCQTKYKYETGKIVDGKIECKPIKKNHIFDTVMISGENEVEIKSYKPSLFYSSYARVKPFIMSFQRFLMYNEVIKPAIEKGLTIIRIMNDSIIVDKRIEEYDNNKLNTVSRFDTKTIGKMVFEKEYHNFRTANLHKFEYLTNI